MMKSLTLIFAIMLLGSVACSDKTEVRTVDELSLHKRSYILFNDGAPIDTCIAMQRRAVDEVRAGTSDEDPVDVLSQLGFFYTRAGDYRNGFELLQEAADYRLAHGESKGTGDIKLYGNLSNLYCRFDMLDESFKMSDAAIAASLKNNGRLLNDLYRMRAMLHNKTGEDDSVFHYYELALDALKDKDDESYKNMLAVGINSDKGGWLIEHYDRYPDSLDRAVGYVEKAIATGGRDMTMERFMLGLGYVRQSRVDEGIKLMERSLSEFEESCDDESVAWATQWLMTVYSETGRINELARMYPRYREVNDTILNREKLNALIASDVKWRAEQKEEENRMLNIELSSARQRLFMVRIIIVLVVLLFGAAALYVRQRSKSARNKRMVMQQRMEELMLTQKKLNGRIEALSEELLNAAHREVVGNVSRLLVPSVLSGEDELKFRKSFAALYPRFLLGLRHDYPSLTPNDELVCMLIYLKQSTDEISLCLGISRASVNSARYRIRTKMALSKETDLDEFLTSRGA